MGGWPSLLSLGFEFASNVQVLRPRLSTIGR
jgi:hypothetical protein